MAQGGFAIFFLMTLLAGALSLVHFARENLDRILAALRRSEPVDEAPAAATARERPTSEMPYVARRLQAMLEDDLAPVTETPRIWTFTRAEAA